MGALLTAGGGAHPRVQSGAKLARACANGGGRLARGRERDRWQIRLRAPDGSTPPRTWPPLPTHPLSPLFHLQLLNLILEIDLLMS